MRLGEKCSCIRTEYREIRTRKNSVFGHLFPSVEQNHAIIPAEKIVLVTLKAIFLLT